MNISINKTRNGLLTFTLLRSSDVAIVHKAITSNITSAVRGAGMAVGGTGMMIYTCPKLALISLLVLPLGGALAVFIGRFIKQKQRQVQV